MLGVGQLGRQAVGVYLGLYLLFPFLLKDGVAFGPRAVERVQLGLVMFSVLVMAVTVATVGERRGSATGPPQQAALWSTFWTTSYILSLYAFSIQAQAWYPSVGTLVGCVLLVASLLR
jgi:hypothetical protein